MEKDLRIKISIDKDTGSLKVVNGEFDELNKKVNKSNSSVSSMKSSLLGLAGAVGGIYAVEKAFEAVIKTGFAFNKNMEDSIAGLTALTVATSSNVSAMGKHLSIAEKYNLSQKEAIKTANELAKINAETPHTLNQTNQIYKAMYVSMKKAGASNEQMINLTKKVSIAAGAAGIEFNSLLAGVDGLATGTVLANSDLGRFLSGLGLTNKELKESSDVVGLLNSKLKDFRAVDNMTTAVSNLQNSWEQLAGILTADMFDSIKEGIKSTTSSIDEMANKLKAIEEANVKRRQFEIKSELEETKRLYLNTFDRIEQSRKTSFSMWTGSEKKLNADLLEYQNKLTDLTKEYDSVVSKINKTNKGDGLTKENKTWQETLNGLDGSSFNGINKMSEAINKKYIDAQEKARKQQIKDSQEWIKALKDFNKFDPFIDEKPKIAASQQVWEDYYNKLKDYKTAWLISDDRSTATTNADLMGLKGADYDKYVNSYKNNYLKKLEDASKKTSKEINYVFTNAFKGMENSLTNFVMTGKMDFNSLANSIISDMVRMSIQQSITKPLTAAFSSAFAGGFGSLFANAHGGAYESASLSQYSNKVIDTPTPFMFANGGVPNLGVFGEAGAEAIMPLTRVGGDLGVKSSPSNVVINIENNSGQEIDASAISEMTRTNERGEQEKVITMVIDGVNRNVKGMRDVLKGIR